MLAKVHSGAVYGVDAYAVEIEACPVKLSRSWVNTHRRQGFLLCQGYGGQDGGQAGRGDVPSPRLWNTGPQTVIVGLPDVAGEPFD